MKKNTKNYVLFTSVAACLAFSAVGAANAVKTASASTATVSSAIQMQEGAGLLLKEESGLRFSYTVSDYSAEAGKNYGMLIVPYDYLAKVGISLTDDIADDYITVLEGAVGGAITYAPIVKENLTPIQEDGEYVFKYSVKNIDQNNYVRQYFGIGFEKTSDGKYVYANQDDNVRSVFEVANKALNKLNYGTWTENESDKAEKELLTANETDVLNPFITKGWEFVYGENAPTLNVAATYIDGKATPTITAEKLAEKENVTLNIEWHYEIDNEEIAEMSDGVVKGLERGQTELTASIGNAYSTKSTTAVLKDETELSLYNNSSQADFFAVDGKISVSGGFYDAKNSNTESQNGTVGYVAFEDTYTLNEQGTYIDVYFTGNNMPIVEFFADGANEYFMSSNTTGKGFIVDNGLAASTANKAGSTSKYNGWSEYDGYFSYGVTSYNNRKRDANSYTVGSYMEYNGVGTGTRQAMITTYSYGNGTESTKGYVDMSMYSLSQVQKADQNYRYTVGMYKDSDGYVWLDSTLYKIDENGTETVFSFWETKAIMEGSAHSVTRDKLNADEVISGKIILRGAVKGRTSANTGTEKSVFTCSAPYQGTNAKSAYEHEGATFNADGTVSLKGAWTQSAAGNYDNIKNATLGYLALEGEYGLGTYVDFYFTGNNMPQLAFFNKYVTNNLSAAYGDTNDNTGVVIINSFYNMNNYNYRYYVYGPNRINSYFNAMSSAYMEGANSSNQSLVSSEALAALSEQRFKYTVGFYADASGNVYFDMDIDKVDENGVKTADYYALNKKLNVTTADIQGNRIIAYGAVNGGTAITFSYSAPYIK